MHESQKGYGKLVIAGGNPSEYLELIEKTLDQMAFFIDVKVTEPRLNRIALRRYRIRSILFGDIPANGLSPVCFIAQNIAPADFNLREQINGGTGIKDISTSEKKVNGISQRIHNSMNFCGLSAVTYTDKLVVFRIYSPFFAPALCGCALIDVLSMHRFSKSASAFNS